MLRIIFFIGLGSSIGGICRYLLQQFIQTRFPSSIPLGTLVVNVIGCLIIGIIYELSGKGNLMTTELRLFLATGLCGGFTTFSSFAYENIALLQDGEFFYTSLYTLLSVAVGFLAVYLGILFIKLIYHL